MTRDEVNLYELFEITEELPNGYLLTEVFEQIKPDKWDLHYKTNAPVRLCPVYGDMRKCVNCEHFGVEISDLGEAIKACTKPFERFSGTEVANMVKLAHDHDCVVKKY